MLKEEHPLSILVSTDGFRLQECPTVDSLMKARSGLVPLREMIPYTQGRAESWKLVEHVNAARARNWPTFKPFEFNGQSIAICGGGPSLGYTLHELRALQKKGAKVMAINRTHDFLLDLPKTHNLPWVKPWAGILLESRRNT